MCYLVHFLFRIVSNIVLVTPALFSTSKLHISYVQYNFSILLHMHIWNPLFFVHSFLESTLAAYTIMLHSKHSISLCPVHRKSRRSKCFFAVTILNFISFSYFLTIFSLVPENGQLFYCSFYSSNVDVGLGFIRSYHHSLRCLHIYFHSLFLLALLTFC